MKVLYVSYDGMTDALGRSQVLPYLLGLSAKGHEIHVISCEKKQVSGKEREDVLDILQGGNIQWSPLAFSTRPPWISKMIDVFKIKRKARQLYRKYQFDIVHCRSYIAALAGLELKMKFGVKFVFDMRGFWANERIEGDMWNLKNPVYSFMFKYFKKKESEFFNAADAVVSLTHNGKSVIKEMFGSPVDVKTSVIPCCVDTDFFSSGNILENEKIDLRKSLGIDEGDFVLSYLGSVGTWYMTDEMLLFFKKLLEHKPNARFLFISGDEPDQILSKAQRLKIDVTRITIARATRNQVPLYLSLSAISIFFIRPVFSKKASSPTKQAEILSMGIPLICNTGVGDTDMIFSDEKAGLVLKDFSNEEFHRAIQKTEDLLKLDPSQIREKALQYFNLDDGVKVYGGIYQKLIP
jgi:glycosyltransferase involved in cell wall biosynthesis